VKSLSAAALALFVVALSMPAHALLSPEASFALSEPSDSDIHVSDVNVDECAFPEPPVIPSGAEASEAALAESGAAVRDYQVAMQDSLACIEDVIASLGDEITPEQDSGLTALYNNGVEQLTMIAESFNSQVRAFKARQAAESSE